MPWCLSSQLITTCDEDLLSLRWLNACLFMGSSEFVPLLVHVSFALAIKLSLLQPRSFFTFPLLITSPIPVWEGLNKKLCGAELAAWVKLLQYFLSFWRFFLL